MRTTLSLLLVVAACGPLDSVDETGTETTTANQELYNPLPGTVAGYVGRIVDANGAHWCTATLITPRHALSAGHCHGGHHLVFGARTVGIASEAVSPATDLLVLTLADYVTTVPTACLKSSLPANGTTLTVSGCGQPTPGTCRFGRVQQTAIKEIRQYFYSGSGPFLIFQPGYLRPNWTTTAFGFGDSGGPTVEDATGFLVGANSYITPYWSTSTGPTAGIAATAPHVGWISSNAPGVCIR